MAYGLARHRACIVFAVGCVHMHGAGCVLMCKSRPGAFLLRGSVLLNIKCDEALRPDSCPWYYCCSTGKAATAEIIPVFPSHPHHCQRDDKSSSWTGEQGDHKGEKQKILAILCLPTGHVAGYQERHLRAGAGQTVT